MCVICGGRHSSLEDIADKHQSLEMHSLLPIIRWDIFPSDTLYSDPSLYFGDYNSDEIPISFRVNNG